MAAAPLIAVFPEYTPAGGSFDAASFHCQANYVQAIKEAGGIPILVPQGLQRQSQEAALGLCDGICLVGGPGLVMGIEGQLPPDLKPVEDRRIASELEALAYCKKEKKSVLGICYGMQLMNVFEDGTLSGDLHADPTRGVHSPRRNAGAPVEHRLHLESRFASDPRWAFLSNASVNSYHLQAVERLGRGFACVARTADGIPEVIESTALSWIGCQFHPERCSAAIRKPIFKLFVGNLTGSARGR